jgi:hypothetical protein
MAHVGNGGCIEDIAQEIMGAHQPSRHTQAVGKLMLDAFLQQSGELFRRSSV